MVIKLLSSCQQRQVREGLHDKTCKIISTHEATTLFLLKKSYPTKFHKHSPYENETPHRQLSKRQCNYASPDSTTTPYPLLYRQSIETIKPPITSTTPDTQAPESPIRNSDPALTLMKIPSDSSPMPKPGAQDDEMTRSKKSQVYMLKNHLEWAFCCAIFKVEGVLRSRQMRWNGILEA